METRVPAKRTQWRAESTGTEMSLQPLPPHISDSQLTPPSSECGLAVGVASGLGQGQGKWGQWACVTPGPGQEQLSLLS